MKLKIFENMKDAEIFLEIYAVSECIVNIDNEKVYVWVDKIKSNSGKMVNCPYCKNLTYEDGKYCRNCGEEMRLIGLC